MSEGHSRVRAAVAAVAAGRVVVIVDAQERENEGDFFIAAQCVTAEAIHFMTTEGRGLVCMPIVAETARRLKLPPMVRGRNSDLAAPAFTVSIDHGRSKTGISPEERALTIQAVADPASAAEDFVRPGHVFPLVARGGGVLRRAGHTEAAVDLAQLAGLTPAGVLCEICSRDGRGMAGHDELNRIAAQFELPIVTIDELIAFRRDLERNGHKRVQRPHSNAAASRNGRAAEVLERPEPVS